MYILVCASLYSIRTLYYWFQRTFHLVSVLFLTEKVANAVEADVYRGVAGMA